MSKIDLLLDGELDVGYIKLNVNEYTRTIAYDGNEIVLGVEGDYKAEKVYFYFPTALTGDFNINSENVKVFITYENADGEVRIHKCTKEDPSIFENTSEGCALYSWTLSSKVTAYAGKVKFMVCAKQYSGNTILNEWHSAICEGTVLEGLHSIDNYTTELYPELSASIEDFEVKVNELKTMFSSITASGYNLEDYFANAEKYAAALEQKADTVHTHPTDNIFYPHASTPAEEVLTATLDSMRASIAALGGGDYADMEFYTKSEVNGYLNTLSTGKADKKHEHTALEVTYAGQYVENALDDLYDNKANLTHTHQAQEVYWYSAPITNTFVSLTNQLNNKADTTYVDDNFVKKEDSHLYEHNIQIVGTSGTDIENCSVFSMVLNLKAISTVSGLLSMPNLVRQHILSGTESDNISGSLIEASGIIKFDNDTANQLHFITGIKATRKTGSMGLGIGLAIAYTTYNTKDGTVTFNNIYDDVEIGYLYSDNCTYYDCVRQII